MTPDRDRLLPWLLAGCVAGGLAAFVLLALVVSMTYDAPPGTEPPKVTDWMQGWGSIAGVLAGAAAAVAASWLLLHERQQAREAREQLREERAEAAKVAARAVQHRSLSATLFMTKTRQVQASLAVTVANYGTEPVRQVSAMIEGGGAVWVLPVAEVVAPQEETRASDRYEVPEIVVPSPESLAKMKVFDGVSLLDTSVTVRFFDSSGREWSRRDNGDPERPLGPIPQGWPRVPD